MMQRSNTIIRITIVAILLTIMNPAESPASDRDEAVALADSIEHDFLQERAELSGHMLEDYLIYAALNNPGLKASFYNWKSELEKSLGVTSLPNPIFTYGYFIESVETRVGPQLHRFRLMQSFPWFGTRGTRGDVTLEAANIEYQKFQSKKLRLFYEVKAAYYDYYFLGREIAIARANIELLENWEAVARTMYKASAGRHTDIIKAQVELGKLEDRLSTLENMKIPVLSRLWEALDLGEEVDLPFPAEISEFESFVDAGSVKSDILSNNPDLKAVNHLIYKEEAAVKLAKKASYPNFMIGVDYIYTGDAIDPTMPDSGKDPWILNAGISLPLWFGKNNAKREQARARLEMARYNLKSKENSLATLADRIVFEYEDAARKVKLYRDGLIPKAEQSLNTAFKAYRSGEIDFLNVIDAQRQLIEFQLQLELARTNTAKKLAEIEMLVGKEL